MIDQADTAPALVDLRRIIIDRLSLRAMLIATILLIRRHA